MINFRLNGVPVEVDVEDDTPLLWVIRENLGMTGTKFGCGISLCGACTVHLNGEAIRSCITPVATIAEMDVATIEGLSTDGLHAIQQAWIELNVPQCGYCQSGQIMSAAALLETTPHPTDDEINAAMSGNICRCGMYGRIRKAIHRAAELSSPVMPPQAEPAMPEPAGPEPATPVEPPEPTETNDVVQLFDPNDPFVRGEMS